MSDSKLGQPAESKTVAASGMPGAALSLSANGREPGTGILWASRPLSGDANRRNVEGILEAYDASNIANAEPLWTNRQNLQRDGGGFSVNGDGFVISICFWRSVYASRIRSYQYTRPCDPIF
jgi:hypothetical protein